MANSQPIVLKFNQYSLTISMVVNTVAAQFEADNNTKYLGYAIVSGSGSYTVNGVSHAFAVAPQSVDPYNVLWANASSGCGGSASGIDQYGLTIAGDLGVLVWSGTGRRGFYITEGALPAGSLVTLGSRTNWPPLL